MKNIWKRKENMEPRSLKRRLLSFLILCWAVPVIVFFFFTTLSYQKGIIQKTESLIEDQMESTAAFITIRLEEVIGICQGPSYERTWENAWKRYCSGEYDHSQYQKAMNSSMSGKFYLDSRFQMYTFYEKDTEYPALYTARAGQSREEYMERVHPIVEEWRRGGLDYTHTEVVDDRLFLIRNLYTTSNYEYFGTLVVELDVNRILRDIPRKRAEDMILVLNEKHQILNYASVRDNTNKEKVIDKILKYYNGYSGNVVKKEMNASYTAYLYQEKFDNFHMGIIQLTEQREIYSSLYDLYEIVIIMMVFFLPLTFYAGHFLQKQIQEPVMRLTVASREMEEGNIGVEVKGGVMPNKEFNYLRKSFNSMSAQVKELFDYIYDEKLAKKDAQILALQAQINPHFLNNTLEMMNWQARMSGDAVVSKMIESLSTVLDYRMNRASVKEIYLMEELRCTDAYFYIMSMRFGQRLQVTRDIDEELLYINVPPLILQPLVENAIIHGVEAVKSGSIGLHIYHDGENVYLEVSNTGKEMTEEEQERIRGLLSGDEGKMLKGKGKHTSIGIRNVNQRIKLVYGEEYGLFIHQNEKGITISTIKIPYVCKQDEGVRELLEEKRQNQERQRMEKELKSIGKRKKNDAE